MDQPKQQPPAPQPPAPQPTPPQKSPSGWKSFIVGGLFVVFGVVLLIYGQTEQGLQQIGIGLAIFAGRMAVEKVIQNQYAMRNECFSFLDKEKKE